MNAPIEWTGALVAQLFYSGVSGQSLLYSYIRPL